jgi:protease-4
MTAVYDLFLRRVAEGRGVSVDQISAAAEGRIFAGEEAKNQHLVDEWGGLERAIIVARELAHLDQDAPVRLSGESGGILDWLDDDSGTEDSESHGLAQLWARMRASVAVEPAAGEESALLASLMPLLRGETALAALPFGLLVH